MKGKLINSWRIALVVVLTVSLGLVFSAPVAAQGAVLDVINHMPDQVFVCDTFTLTSEVQNNGDEVAQDVMVSLGVSPNLTLVSGEWGHWLGDICPGESKETSWLLKCTGPGDSAVQVWVEETGVPEPAMNLEVSEFEQVCKLSVEITEPMDGTDYSISDQYAVTAEVTNNTDMTCGDVMVALEISENAELIGGELGYNIGPIDPGDTQEVNWTLHCTGRGDVMLTATATGCGTDMECVAACADSITVHQLELCGLEVWIDDTYQGEICECTDFTVPGWVKNIGDFDVTDVSVGISITKGIANYVSGPGTISSLAPGQYEQFEFTLHCDGREEPCENPDYVSVSASAGGYCQGNWITSNTAEANDIVDQKWLMVDILDPAHCTDVCLGDEILVDVEVFNCYDEEVSGTLSIDWNPSSGLVLVDGPIVQEVSIPANSSIVLSDEGGPVQYHLQCEEAGDVDITVSYIGVAPAPIGLTLCDDDTVQIHQKHSASLDVTMSAPDCALVCDNFWVEATVKNDGGVNADTASNVSATLSILGGHASIHGDATINIRDLPAGDSESVAWEVHCDDWANVSFQVNVSGTGTVCDASLSDSATDSTTQIDLDIEIISPDPCTEFSVCDTYCVTAAITNNDADNTNIPGTATIELIGAAELVDGETASKAVSELLYGDTQEISWTVHCTDLGDVDILVHYAFPSPCDMSISDSITVHQSNPPIGVEILSPDWGIMVATSEEFALTAKVTNMSDGATAYNIPITLGSQCDNVDIVGPDDIQVVELLPGESEMLTWTLHCSGSGLSVIDVWSPEEGIGDMYEYDTDDLMDTIIVWQYPAAHLEVEIIDAPDMPIVTSTHFPVTAIITNTGEADASEVYATLSVTPEGSVRVSADDPEGTYTKYVGTIPGHGSGDNSRMVTWDLHCKLPCESEIVVTASGNDEYGWHIKQHNGTTGSFIIDGGALISEQLGPTPPEEPNRGWAYGLFVGDANGLAPGPFNIDSDLSIAAMGGGPDFLGHLSGTGFVLPGGSECVIDPDLLPAADVLDFEGMFEECSVVADGKDMMLWIVHITMDSEYDIIGPYDTWCVEDGLLEIINGTISGSYMKWHEGMGEYQDSLLAGTFISNMAAQPGLPIQEGFIEADGVTVKQLPIATDLAVTKMADEDTVTMGGEVMFTIEVMNHGPSDASGVMVSDLLPAGVNYMSSDADMGWYDVTSGTWLVGDLALNDTATLEIMVKTNMIGEISNIASISACDQGDPNTSNNSAMVTIMSEAAAAITGISVIEGYNLISLPWIPEDTDLEFVLADILGDVQAAANWPGGNTGNFNYWWAGDPPPDDDFDEMMDGIGYFLLMDNSGTFAYAGYEIAAPAPAVPPSYDVVPGWNLIGFKSTTPKLPTDYLAAIDGMYTVIYGFENGSYFIVGSPGHEYLQPGLGYWIAMLDLGTIYP